MPVAPTSRRPDQAQKSEVEAVPLAMELERENVERRRQP
jgi:hypothetical protein